jgi:anti-sigma regulatory factor (Ser/Thr protein kinase)
MDLMPRGVEIPRAQRQAATRTTVASGNRPSAHRTRTWRLPEGPDAIRRARDQIELALQAWGTSAPVDDIKLAASELATNAIRHGRAPVVLTLRHVASGSAPPTVELEVRDAGGNAPPGAATDTRLDDPLPTSGRGLAIVSALAARWGVAAREPGTTVWCAFQAS